MEPEVASVSVSVSKMEISAGNLQSNLTMMDILAGGVDFELAGNGGPDCRDHVPISLRALEVAVSMVIFALSLLLGQKFDQGRRRDSSTEQGPSLQPSRARLPPWHSLAFLVVFSVVYGVEVSYKFATRQVIFLLNCCHVLTVTNILVLAAYVGGRLAHSPAWQVLHRLNCFMIHCPIAAMIFPVTHTLQLPLEVETYWVQHGLVAVAPLYITWLISRESGGKSARGFLSTAMISYGVLCFYHFIVLQGASLATLANVGNMLCAAPSDPFGMKYYRMHGWWHQLISVLFSGLICTAVEKTTTTTTEESVSMKDKSC